MAEFFAFTDIQRTRINSWKRTHEPALASLFGQTNTERDVEAAIALGILKLTSVDAAQSPAELEGASTVAVDATRPTAEAAVQTRFCPRCGAPDPEGATLEELNR